jgi:phosphopantetheine--protein transferase-like protein
MNFLSIGNDIVDLGTVEPDLHPRFQSRVFTAREIAQIQDQRSKLWAFWSAKEAAYKALKRINPQLVFSPVKFEFDAVSSSITFENLRLDCCQILNNEYVHSSCTNVPDLLRVGNYQTWIEDFSSSDSKDISEVSPSVAVRRLAIRKVAALLKLETYNLDISTLQTAYLSKKSAVPILTHKGQPCPHLLSFSHHGRFVAVVLCLQN